MDFVGRLGGWEPLLSYFMLGTLFILLILVLARLIRWAKGMPAGAYLAFALFPLISLFPIPPSEIKKLQRIKQEEVKRDLESGDPAGDDPPSGAL
ncbi:hypothetical protein [Shewanella aegiceratis]|uniref:hypothetical protein n=1 Tax=Shewanella aegiceratis TaxID=2864203 RepID=UPI001C65F1C0|nr:hypothetical protein [Shewanella aegiceratis]QYJ84516.1 hypothetical protein K0H80_16405 [Shewanella aegiceratis]